MRLQDTTSLCPRCFLTIPATLVDIDGSVWMEKTCPKCGPCPSTLVEPHSNFWRSLKAMGRKPSSYNQLLVDVTSRCNLDCPHCYYPIDNKAEDESLRRLYMDAKCVDLDLILGGGEPTVRNDLHEVIAALRSLGRRVTIITNGVKLAQQDYASLLGLAGLYDRKKNVYEASISLHTPEYNGRSIYDRKLQALDNIFSTGSDLGELMFTVSDMDEAIDLLPVIQKYDRVSQFRIRAPGALWNEKNHGSLFVSDLCYAYMHQAITDGGAFRIAEDEDNNIYHTTLLYDIKDKGTRKLRLIAWPDEHNVVLPELLGYGPFHRSVSGEITNFVHSLLINKGVQQGWLHGTPVKIVMPKA